MTWPTWITPPTRGTDRLAIWAIWDLSFGRAIYVEIRSDGWRVLAPEIPKGMTYHHEEAAELAQYVEAQRIRPARVVVETPYGDSVFRLRAQQDSQNRLEAPIVRSETGLVWVAVAEAVVVYEDNGVDAWMQAAIDEAERLRVPVERRILFDTPGRPCQN